MSGGDAPVAGRRGPVSAGIRAADGDATWRFAAAGVVPRAVVRPASVADLVEVVRRARERREAIIPVGRGSRLDIGNPPRRYDLAVSTEQMAVVEAHVVEDMTVTAQAGTTLRRLNEVLAEGGQWLPLDPAAADQTTVGGLIAADANGPLRHAYGKVRDYLLGVELVSGAGEIVRAGGRVVKNVAGYDVSKLLCGSFGTLGIVTAATFKTRPVPASQRLYAWLCADLGEAIRRAAVVDCGDLSPSLVEALNEGACESIGLECAAALVVEVAGSPVEVEQQDRALMAASGGAARPWPAEKSWGVLQAIRNFALPVNEDALVARVATRPADLADLMNRVEREARHRGASVEIAAHAGVGVARCQLFGGGDTTRLALLSEWLRLAFVERGGWVVFEAMPADLRGKLDTWGFNQPTLSLMRGVKQVFDPQGLLSPGRFIGGI